MKTRFIIVFVSCINLIFSQYSLNDSLSSRLETIKNKFKLAGLSVTVLRNNAIFATGSAGLSDIARSIPVTDSTTYRIASISKTVAATALMQLYEQGKFKLDDDISSSIGFNLRNPNYPNDPITFRMVLSHTATVQDGSGYNNFLSATSSNPPPLISSVLVSSGEYYSSDMWLNRKPGTYFTYTNMGFGIVGTLVENLSGERFDQYCKKHIFKPLGLEASFNVEDLQNINNLAVLYRVSGGSWVPQADNYKGVQPVARDYSKYIIGSNGSVFGPQGNLRISAKDLAKFMIVRMNGGIYTGVRILNDSTATLMNTPVWTFNGSNGDNYYGLFRSWGLGTHITTNAAKGDIVIPGKTMVGHPGEAYGLISDAYCEVNKNEFGIIFITNGKNGSYSFGTSSAFYDVEEAVFSSVNNFIQTNPTSIEMKKSELHPRFELQQNYPNPFNPSTDIEFTVPDRGHATLKIFSNIGQEITTLYNGEVMGKRKYTVKFNASKQSSGVYFSRLEYGGSIQYKKILFLQ
jgi:CubicO group peptidase (beta-lactamase class C family)